MFPVRKQEEEKKTYYFCSSDDVLSNPHLDLLLQIFLFILAMIYIHTHTHTQQNSHGTVVPFVSSNLLKILRTFLHYSFKKTTRTNTQTDDMMILFSSLKKHARLFRLHNKSRSTLTFIPHLKRLHVKRVIAVVVVAVEANRCSCHVILRN